MKIERIALTRTFARYRAVKRDLWNNQFLGLVDSKWDRRLTLFESIDALLFDAMVLCRVGSCLGDRRYRTDPISEVSVKCVPQNSSTQILASGVYGASRVWDNVEVRPGTVVSGTFVDLFEWDRYGMVRFDLVQIRVAKFSGDTPAY